MNGEPRDQCEGCGRMLPETKLYGTRCRDCYVEGDKPKQRVRMTRPTSDGTLREDER